MLQTISFFYLQSIGLPAIGLPSMSYSSVPKNADIDLENSVFFVGDSTVFGTGTSDPRLFSLPAQFKNLVRTHNPDFNTFNPSYAGTGTEDHLKLMSQLPENATVIYRGGASDRWCNGAWWKVGISGRKIELKTIKMTMMLFSYLLQNTSKLRKERAQEEMEYIIKKNKLNIFVLDYTVVLGVPPTSPFYDTQNPAIIRIPLYHILKKAGFTAPSGFLYKQFIAQDGGHSNDSGVKIEAVALFNYFAARNMFGLIPENIIELQNPLQ
jgi:hypothetical protein